MRDDEANLTGFDPGAEVLGGLRRNWLGVPLVRVLRKNLARGHVERRGAFDGQRMATGNRHMRAKQPHRSILHHSSFLARGHGDHTTELDRPWQRPGVFAYSQNHLYAEWAT